MNSSSDPRGERILVRGVNWLGDAIMTTPALQRLRTALPAAKISILSAEKLGDLWQGQPFVDEVLTFSASESAWSVGRRMRAGKFTCAIAFPNSVRSAFELWSANIPRRIGRRRFPRGIFLTDVVSQRVDAVRMHKRSLSEVRTLIATNAAPEIFAVASHHVHDYLQLTALLGASCEPLPPRIDVGDKIIADVRARFGLADADARPLLGLNPGAEYGQAKRWPADRFVQSASAICQLTRCRWLVFGGKSDLPLAERITHEIQQQTGDNSAALNLAGQTTLRELAAALKLCRLVVTNDTGPMHLASAVGTPVIVPFGSTSPELTGPIFASNAAVLRQPPPCAPCFLRDCPIDLRCLTAISSDAVVNAAMAIMAQR